MRRLRSNKFRKRYKKLAIFTQILAIWYATVITAGVLTSNTFAYFSDSNSTIASFQTGTWWDQSDLEFIGTPNTENIKECAPWEISIEIKNKGFDMIGTTEYEVYFIENGNPQNGEKIAEGIINPMESGKTAMLSYLTEENGSYMFKIYQRPGYKDNYEERKELWSKKFMVNCNANKTDKDLDENKKANDNNLVEGGKEDSEKLKEEIIPVEEEITEEESVDETDTDQDDSEDVGNKEDGDSNEKGIEDEAEHTTEHEVESIKSTKIGEE